MPGTCRQVGGQALDEVASAPGVDHAAGARLLLQEELRVARDAGREIGRQRQRLVQRIGVQRLGAALRCGHGLDAGACHVVEDILCRKAPAARLAMRAKAERALVLRVEPADQLGPDHAGGAHLGHFHEEVHADGPEEGQPRREPVDRQARGHAGTRIFQPVGQRIAKFEIRRRARFLHVIAGDRDRIELRHALGGVSEDVGNDPHRRGGRIDEGVPHHEFLEDVVLDGAGQLFRRHALFLARHDVERHDRQHRAVHGHRHGHLVQRDAVEERPHVIDRVDRHARHADIARHAGMVRIIAAMGGEIEGDGQSHLPGRQVPPVEGIGIFRGGEARVLADGPGLRGVHGGVGAAQEGCGTWPGVEEVDALHVLRPVAGLHRQAFGRQPVVTGTRRDGFPFEANGAEVRDAAHASASTSAGYSVGRR